MLVFTIITTVQEFDYALAVQYGIVPTNFFNEINGTSDTSQDHTLSQIAKFGTSVSGIGDVNGDGIPDIAVGAPSGIYSDCNVDCGSIYMRLGHNCDRFLSKVTTCFNRKVQGSRPFF